MIPIFEALLIARGGYPITEPFLSLLVRGLQNAPLRASGNPA